MAVGVDLFFAAFSAFLLCGAVKMSLQFRSGGFPAYPAYLQRRAAKIYAPYLAAAVLYFIAFVCLGFINFDFKQLLEHLLLGSISAPFYFIIICPVHIPPFDWPLGAKQAERSVAPH